MTVTPWFRTRCIGANPEKSDLVNFGVRTKENLVNFVFFCFSWEKSTKCSQNPGLVNEFSATPRGQLNWTGPIANGSDWFWNLDISHGREDRKQWPMHGSALTTKTPARKVACTHVSTCKHACNKHKDNAIHTLSWYSGICRSLGLL